MPVPAREVRHEYRRLALGAQLEHPLGECEPVRPSSRGALVDLLGVDLLGGALALPAPSG